MRFSRRGSLLVYSLIVVLAVISLMTLFRLRDRFEAGLAGRINDLQRVFSNRDLLKTPADTKFSFYEVEAEVAKYEFRGDFGQIRIAKRMNGGDHVIYPFYQPALDSAGIAAPVSISSAARNSTNTGWQKFFMGEKLVELPLVDRGERLGTLYVDVQEGPYRTVSFVIWALGTMLAASLAFLATQFRKQEKVISATTIELEEKRRELVRLERLALAGQLSANILHDLKKPVLNIRNEADEAIEPLGALADVEPPPAVFERIREQADFFLSMLKEAGFDRFVRASEEREYVDINDLLDRSIALVRYEQASVQVGRNYDTDLPPILADPVRLIQVFSNLVLNAYQAMDGRGNLQVETLRQDSELIVEFSDNGPGIPPERLTHIFEPFYTTKEPGQGTGLGLYIVRDILRDLGGRISVDSEPGRTEFRLVFPVN